MYFVRSTLTVALQTSWPITLAVDTPTRKRCEIILYFMLVPSLYYAIATLFSTGTAAHTVLESCKHPLSSEHMLKLKISLPFQIDP